jgi:hypothetical protein
MPLYAGGHHQPTWCKCADNKGRRAAAVVKAGGAMMPGGPYVAPPGHVTAFVFESQDAAAFREICRLAGNAERQARDDLSLRWVRSGKGWRELPRSSPKRRALESAYAKASRALDALRARCPHSGRSPFDKTSCDVCYEYVECDVDRRRHLVREVGEAFANRVAS